ncbi:type I restriction-modification system [Nonlabens tegetincola]|uniref:Type I restriction-modification system n=1 Tax=Nonlabens tegetincola TaxID=323273 RepID=A0A090Q422_9FLAO|nr:restriction endonuclease subunit S [Nonlabens tegetincola]GAK96932.1 type I restriction-modification system [Nonlabens tegetincola]
MEAIKATTYDNYKDSGIEWLGDIPEHWEVIRLKNVIRLGITDGPHETPEFIENGIPFLSVDSIQNGELIFEKCRFISEEDHLKYKKKCYVEKNDILMGKAASIGKIAQSKVDFEYSIWSPLALIKPSKEKIISTYLEFYLKSSYSQYQIEILSTSNTQKNISMGDIPKIQISLPPLPEQTAIAQFLDDKTTKIDQAIAIKQQQIALLKERKQILIQKAVTRGLNDKVALKDSGVEWIGEIPEHWKISKLKYFTKQIVDGAHFTPSYVEKGIPFLRVTDISNEYAEDIDWDNTKFIPLKEHLELIKRANPEKGDVLLSKNGTIGVTKLIDWDIEFSFFVSLCLIKFTELLDPNYFCHLFDSPLVDKQITFGSSRTSVTNLHLEKIKELLVIIPPIEEQMSISRKIIELNSRYNQLILNQRNQVAKLQEYKSSLINSVVTGKVKVC